MKKRILSLLLAGGMILTSLVVPGGGASTVEAAPGDSLVAWYKFDDNFDDSISSSKGTEPSDSGEGTKPSFVTDEERNQVMNADGDSRATIRTDNPLYNKTGLTGFTVSAWINADAVNSFRGIWSFSPGVDEGADGYFGLSTTGTLFYNKSARTPDYLDMYDFENTITADGGWEYITVVMDQTTVSMYKDGMLVKTITPSTSGGHGASNMLEYIKSTPYIYFGTASPYHDDASSWGSGDFQMDDFKVYDTALNADRVVEEYLADKVAADKVIAADLAAITIPESTLVDLVLPTAGTSGFTTITWESEQTGVIDGNGKVTRPANGMAEVTLTATATAGEFSAFREFTVKVPAANPSGDIEIYKDQLTLNAGYVSEDITLPASSGDAKVDWASNEPDVISQYGVVTRPETNTEVTLKATLSLDGAEDVTKEFKVIVLAKGGNVATYVSNDPGLNTDALRGQIGGMMIAAENEEGTYDVLHKEQPIMYTAQGAKAYVSPQVFRKADGTFGMIAADGGNNSRVFLYDTEDLITYKNETQVTLSGIANISKLYMIYDMTDEEYRLYAANSAGTVYLLTSKDLETFTAAEQTDFVIPEVTNAPEYAVWASETALTQAEYDKVTNKFTNPYNTSLEYNKQDEITVEAGADIEAALDEAFGEVTAEYSNGEEKTYSIRWNSDDLEKADSTRSGMEYTIRGTIGGSAYFTEAEAPLIEERADPSITYDEDLDRYYFTASYPVNGKDGADGYDRLVIRVADTIEGLADAEEYVIWDESETEGYGQFIWAPELHKIGGSWYFISTAAVGENGYSFDIRPFMMKCNDVENITDPDSWGDPVRVEPNEGDISCLQVMSLDMTYFEAGGKSYVSWADKTQENLSKVFIATVDPEKPWKLTSNATVLTTPEYSWESVNIAVNEGSAAFVKDGTVYLAFSAAATGAEYCVGLMTADADADADLTNIDNWTKVPYPVLTSGDFNDELCGPGHNSFTTDEHGNLVIVYHARPAEEHAGHGGDPLYDACRHAYVKPVLFDSEGMPVLNLSDEEFAMGGSEITVKVKVEGEYEEAKPVLEYNFDEELTDGKAKDSVGDNDATLHGQPAYVQDESYGQVLYLDGDDGDYMGGHDSYLEFPQGFFDGMDNVTISMDVNEVSRTGAYFTFGIGQNRNKYFFLKMQPTNLKLAITENTWSGEQVAEKGGAYPNNSRTWMNLKIVATPDRISLYRDGELIAERDVTVSMSDLGDDLLAYLGKSFYEEDLYFRGYFDNVKVYDYAMGRDEIARVYADEEAARTAMLSDVQRVADMFEIPNADNIKGNITLPSEQNGVSIEWTSSNESVISTAVTENPGYDSTPAGVVTRGSADENVTLTAVFSKDGQEPVTKTYEVTVRAKTAEVSDDDYVGYLFVHFVGSQANAAQEQTYFSISEDGLNWSELNDGQAIPALTSTIGESGLRDHYIGRSADGDKYYMIATDLSIYHNKINNDENWGGAGGSGSHGIVVWESDDLVNWSEPWIAEIAPENAGCTWAPEFIYDEITGEYVVYWSSTTLEVDEDDNVTQEYENHTIYYAKTRDFHTFTETQVYHSGGVDGNEKPIKIIDSTMIEDDGTYYRYTKNEMNGTIMIDCADSVLGDFTTIESDFLSETLPASQGAVEGPIIFKLNETDSSGNDQWCLMVDRYGRNQGYYPLITTDLSDGEAFRMLDSDEYSMPDPSSAGKYRHGYVMPLTAKEYDALQREWGTDDYFSTYLLESTIDSAEAIDQSKLTDESAAALRAAIATANEALTAAEESKEMADVEAAAAALQSVIDNLEYKVVITLNSLDVTPSKTTYTAGDAFDETALTAYAIYSSGARVDVTDAVQVDASQCNMDAAGTYTVTVSYTEGETTVTDTFQITVNSKDEPKPPTDPEEEAPEPSQRPGNPQNPNTSDPAEGAGENGGAVQTGDTTNILSTAMACIFALAGAAVIVMIRRRRRF